MEIQNKELHRIVTTAIIYKPDFTYLAVKRAMDKIFPGKWTVPGGGLSIDDYINTPYSTKAKQWYGVLEKSLKREIKEEVNLEIGKAEYLTDLTFVRSNGMPVLCLSFFAPYVSGEVKLDEEATEFAWITVDQAGDYDFIDGIDQEIREVDQILKARSPK